MGLHVDNNFTVRLLRVIAQNSHMYIVQCAMTLQYVPLFQGRLLSAETDRPHATSTFFSHFAQNGTRYAQSQNQTKSTATRTGLFTESIQRLLHPNSSVLSDLSDPVTHRQSHILSDVNRYHNMSDDNQPGKM